jgi:hypothetical protein
MLKFTVIALLAFTTLTAPSAAFACPQGYVVCGEQKQLCCPS